MAYPGVTHWVRDQTSTEPASPRGDEVAVSSSDQRDSTDPRGDRRQKRHVAPPSPTSYTDAAPLNDPSDETVVGDAERVIVTEEGRRYPLRVYEPLLAPNDTYADQWWVSGTGLNNAWDTATGPYHTTVAVIDTGYALQHEEFANRWHTNNGESGPIDTEAPSKLNCTDRGLAVNASCNNIDDDYDGVVDNETGPAIRENPSKLNCTAQNQPLDKACNNIDDDGNGLVDDSRGWDFSNFDHSVQAGQTNPLGEGTTHGTTVAGILGATGNNGRGVAGVNWTTTILPIQALDDDGYGDTLTVARSVRYAADQGADIISISLGSSASDPYLREAIAYALDAGSIVIAASGNDGCDCISYPARYPEVLAVGASDQAGNRSGFSSYGANLDLVAPGQDMISPTWISTNGVSAYAGGIAGTSFATPYTAGLLALARSHQPEATWGELTAALTETLDHRGQTAGSPRSPGIGYGVTQADALLARVTTPLTTGMRYYFGPMKIDDTLESARPYHCEAGRQPTTPLYTLKRASEIRYTTSELTRYRASLNGWTANRLLYGCVGLPNDAVSTPRVINLLSEVHNRTR